MSQSPSPTPPKQGAITPQSLNRGTREERWEPFPSLSTVVTERFFKLSPMEMAPSAVRWAHTLSWFWLGLIPFLMFMFLTNNPVTSDTLGLATFYPLFWTVILFTNRGLRRGTRAGWWLQIPLSILGLFSCWCLSIPFYGYILSQWFKPEVKAWFDLH